MDVWNHSEEDSVKLHGVTIDSFAVCFLMTTLRFVFLFLKRHPWSHGTVWFPQKCTFYSKCIIQLSPFVNGNSNNNFTTSLALDSTKQSFLLSFFFFIRKFQYTFRIHIVCVSYSKHTHSSRRIDCSATHIRIVTTTTANKKKMNWIDHRCFFLFFFSLLWAYCVWNTHRYLKLYACQRIHASTDRSVYEWEMNEEKKRLENEKHWK